MKSTSTTLKTLRLYLRYTFAYKRDFFIGSIGSVLANITQSIIPPLIIAKMFVALQRAYAEHIPLEFKHFKSYIIAYAFTMLNGHSFGRIQSDHVWQSSKLKYAETLPMMFTAICRRRVNGFHADHFAGALVSQTNKFIGSYERLMDDFIWNILPGLTSTCSESPYFFLFHRDMQLCYS